jgi:hypothetical protein
MSGGDDMALGPDWQQAAVDQKAFEREQARLVHVWTFSAGCGRSPTRSAR